MSTRSRTGNLLGKEGNIPPPQAKGTPDSTSHCPSPTFVSSTADGAADGFSTLISFSESIV